MAPSILKHMMSTKTWHLKKNLSKNVGHFEFPPYNQDTLRSVYHIRNVDVFKLKQVNGSFLLGLGTFRIKTT